MSSEPSCPKGRVPGKQPRLSKARVSSQTPAASKVSWMSPYKVLEQSLTHKGINPGVNLQLSFRNLFSVSWKRWQHEAPLILSKGGSRVVIGRRKGNHFIFHAPRCYNNSGKWFDGCNLTEAFARYK